MMERELKNKTVVITGGAQGIGNAIVDEYLKRGAKVVILLDIDEKRGSESVRTLNAKYGSGKAEFLKCDVTTDLEVTADKIIKKHKVVDILVNNAGVLNEFSVKKTIDINVTALMEWTLRFFEHMRKDKGGNGGTIINMASIYGFRVDQFLPIYHASKFAVMGFTRVFGHQYRYERYGVRCVALCPGFTETVLVTDVRTSEDPVVEKDFQDMMKQMPWQKVDSVGVAAADVVEVADSGSAWFVEGGKPVAEVEW